MLKGPGAPVAPTVLLAPLRPQFGPVDASVRAISVGRPDPSVKPKTTTSGGPMVPPPTRCWGFVRQPVEQMWTQCGHPVDPWNDASPKAHAIGPGDTLERPGPLPSRGRPASSPGVVAGSARSLGRAHLSARPMALAEPPRIPLADPQQAGAAKGHPFANCGEHIRGAHRQDRLQRGCICNDPSKAMRV